MGKAQVPSSSLAGPFPLLCSHVAVGRRGKSEGGFACAVCGVFVQLLKAGMCSVGEEKCSKPNFFPKLPFFQTLSGGFPERIRTDAISSNIAQGFAQSLKLSSAFPFPLGFL